MSGRSRSPRTELLVRLLEAHERSVWFSRPGPWSRDVIVRLDGGTFPEAFAPDGLDARKSLAAAAAELAAEGRLRVVRHARGPLSDEVKEVRLGPDEVERAYDAARALGYEPLGTALREVEHHAESLRLAASTPWMNSYLAAVADGARTATTDVLGMSRARVKECWRDLLPALTAATRLADGIAPAWERVVSERLLGDSKRLARLRPMVIAVLLRADPRWDGVAADDAADLLEAYGVRRKPGLLRCAGTAAIEVAGRQYQLADFEPVAHLPEKWSHAWVEAVAASSVRQITTVENEFPFLAYVEESGGPRGLGARGEVVVYTAGFPTPALVTTLASLAERAPDAAFRHWGDADVGGLRIWCLLRERIAREVALFRTTATWVNAEAERGGQALSDGERSALERLRKQLTTDELPDACDASELISALLLHGIKIEQERY